MMMEIGIRRRRRVGRSSHLLSATIAGCTEDGFDERNAQESTASDSSALTETTRTALSLSSRCAAALPAPSSGSSLRRQWQARAGSRLQVAGRLQQQAESAAGQNQKS